MTLTYKPLYNSFPNDSQWSDAPYLLKSSTRGDKTENRRTVALEAAPTEAENRFSKVCEFFSCTVCAVARRETLTQDLTSNESFWKIRPAGRTDSYRTLFRWRRARGDVLCRAKTHGLQWRQKFRLFKLNENERGKSEDKRMRTQSVWQGTVV